MTPPRTPEAPQQFHEGGIFTEFERGEFTATYYGHQPGIDPIGRGQSESEAIADLKERQG